VIADGLDSISVSDSNQTGNKEDRFQLAAFWTAIAICIGAVVAFLGFWWRHGIAVEGQLLQNHYAATTLPRLLW
jgi:hypothetical protein